MRQRLIFLALLVAAAAWGASNERARKLQERLVAPCCWNESVAHHRSEVAGQIRAQIESMVAAGQSDREILDHFVAQYGKRILIEPEGSTRTVATVMPFVFLLVGGVFTVFVIRRMLHPPAAPQQNRGAP